MNAKCHRHLLLICITVNRYVLMNKKACSEEFSRINDLHLEVILMTHFDNLLASVKPMTILFTLAISKCYGKVRVFFPRDNSLVSDRNSHNSLFWSSGKMLAFQPRGSGLEPVPMRYFFYKIFEAEDSHFFRQ